MLDSAGGAGIRERSIITIEYRSAFLGVNRDRQKATPLEPAWPVGDLVWKTPGRWNSGELTSPVPSGITRARALVPMESLPRDDRQLEAWSSRLSEGPLGNDQVRRQVLDALERLVAGLSHGSQA